MIKLFLADKEIPFDITIFPDKTSQVWHTEIPLFDTAKNAVFTIQWDFEDEAEFIKVLQLADLVATSHASTSIPLRLKMDYLPYARQDKKIAKDATFALHTFIHILTESAFFDNILVVDAHNPKVLTHKFQNYIPNKEINEVLEQTGTTVVCYPDKGAAQRGYVIDEDKYGHVILAKKRNQTTGEIEGLKFAAGVEPKLDGAIVMLVDDLGDGMRTFIEAAKLLYKVGAKEVNVWTTHGLYTKGTKIVFDAGIKRIFNIKGEVKDVW